MNEKLLSALKLRYKTLGLSDKSFSGVAEFLSKTMTDESNIDEVVNGAEMLLKAVQGEADRVRLDSTNKIKEMQEKQEALSKQLETLTKSQGKPGEKKGGSGDEEIPAWAKALQETVTGLAKEKAQEAQRQKQEQLKRSAKELMLKQEIDNSLCDDILSEMQISDTDTPELLAEKGVEKFNYLKTKFAPQAGSPNVNQGEGGAEVLDEFFKAKTSEFEQAQKSLENADIK